MYQRYGTLNSGYTTTATGVIRAREALISSGRIPYSPIHSPIQNPSASLYPSAFERYNSSPMKQVLHSDKEPFKKGTNMGKIQIFMRRRMKSSYATQGKDVIVFVPRMQAWKFKMDREAVGLKDIQIKGWKEKSIMVTRIGKLNAV